MYQRQQRFGEGADVSDQLGASETAAEVELSVAAVIVLAAGAGTRMKSAKSKLLHEVAGRSLLQCVIDATAALDPQHTVVVVGHDREQVEAHLAEIAPYAIPALQPKRLGTGDAVRCALAALAETASNLEGDVIVINGDSPLLEGETLRQITTFHQEHGNRVTVMTSIVPDPTGYGRIIRNATGDQVEAIVEHRDCTEEQRKIAEINSGLFVFDAALLRRGVASLQANNDQGELYLTDVLGYAHDNGEPVGAWLLEDYLQAEGVNDRVQLAEMNAEANRRILKRHMLNGVTILDPASTWIHASVSIGQDTVIYPNTQLYGATTIGANAHIGPETTLTDVEVGDGATVQRTQGSLAIIGAEATVGPFSFLRPGTELGVKGKIGGFVETKNAKIGDGAKVPHLTYCGDAVIGEGANIGAGTIFANYDGTHKHQTTVGAHSFVGSNSVLLAPVQISDGAYVAGGSAITDFVGPGELAVARSRQRNIPGWVAKRRPGTKTEAAAAQAKAAGESIHQADANAHEKES